jgi:hypothetical protein
VADVVALGVDAQGPFHSGHDIGLRSLEMKIVAHQAPGMDLKAGLLAGFSKGFEEILTINIIVKDVFPSISTAHHVINGAGISNSDFPGHFVKINRARRLRQSNVLVTPFLDVWRLEEIVGLMD